MADVLGIAAVTIAGGLLFGIMLMYDAKRRIWLPEMPPDTSEAIPYVDDAPTLVLARCTWCLHYHQAHDWCALREAELVASHADN